MSRNLKALGLAFVAVFAMSALTASAAHATEEFFHSHKEKTIITAENVGTGHTGSHVFEVGAGLTVVCTTAKFEGTEVGTKHESTEIGTTYTTEFLTTTPTYSGCTAFGKAATVKPNECHYMLFAATTETTAGKPHGNVEITCPTGKTIDIEVPAIGVVIHVGPQLIPHVVNYTNVNTEGGTEKEEITISATSPKNITWSCTPKATCTAGIGVTGGTEAQYTGLATAKGFEDLNAKPSETGSTGTYVYEEGARTGIWKGPAK